VASLISEHAQIVNDLKIGLGRDRKEDETS
jgi:hypothetical protein